MADGRRWNRVPIILLTSAANSDLNAPRTSGVIAAAVLIAGATVIGDDVTAAIIDTVADEVEKYQRRLIGEFEDLGFLITEESGRLRLGPALTPRGNVEGELYLGSADRRPADHWFTIRRDSLAINYDADLFEDLINRSNVSEPELQNFFEGHPYFLTAGNWKTAIPHPRLGGGTLIPDFVLEPIVAKRRARDSEWQVLDLKKPQERLLVGSATRKRLSAAVHKAIAQLREYQGYFNDPAHAVEITGLLGAAVRFPQLAVLIGRQRDLDDLAALDRQQEVERVRIVTYDEILDRQRALARRRRG